MMFFMIGLSVVVTIGLCYLVLSQDGDDFLD